MADKYKVLIGFNVVQKDGSEVRVEPGGKQFTITNTEKDGVIYQEAKTMKAKPIDELLTKKQIIDLLGFVPPVLEVSAVEEVSK